MFCPDGDNNLITGLIKLSLLTKDLPFFCKCILVWGTKIGFFKKNPIYCYHVNTDCLIEGLNPYLPDFFISSYSNTLDFELSKLRVNVKRTIRLRKKEDGSVSKSSFEPMAYMWDREEEEHIGIIKDYWLEIEETKGVKKRRYEVENKEEVKRRKV